MADATADPSAPLPATDRAAAPPPAAATAEPAELAGAGDGRPGPGERGENPAAAPPGAVPGPDALPPSDPEPGEGRSGPDGNGAPPGVGAPDGDAIAPAAPASAIPWEPASAWLAFACGFVAAGSLYAVLFILERLKA